MWIHADVALRKATHEAGSTTNQNGTKDEAAREGAAQVVGLCACLTPSYMPFNIINTTTSTTTATIITTNNNNNSDTNNDSIR